MSLVKMAVEDARLLKMGLKYFVKFCQRSRSRGPRATSRATLA